METVKETKNKKELTMQFTSFLIYIISIANFIVMPLIKSIRSGEAEYFSKVPLYIFLYNFFILAIDQFEKTGNKDDDNKENNEKLENNLILTLINSFFKLLFFLIAVIILCFHIKVYKSTDIKILDCLSTLLPITLTLLSYFRIIRFIEFLEAKSIHSLSQKHGQFSILPVFFRFIAWILINFKMISSYNNFISSFIVPTVDVDNWIQSMLFFLKTILKCCIHFDFSVIEKRYELSIQPDDINLICLKFAHELISLIFLILLICVGVGFIFYAVISLIYKISNYIVRKGMVIMKDFLIKILRLDKPLTPGRRTGSEGIICPFCQEVHSTYRVINSNKHDLKKYKFKPNGTSLYPPNFLITSRNESIKYNKENRLLLNKDDKVVLKSETFNYITNINEITKETIDNKKMSEIDFNYICVPNDIVLYNGSQRATNLYFEVCSVCGLEYSENITDSRIVYFIGEKNAGKTSIIYKLMDEYNIINFLDSYDYLFWKNIYNEGKINGKVTATSIQQSPPLYIKIKSKEYCLFDVAGEKLDEIIENIQTGTICITIGLDNFDNEILNVEAINESIGKIIAKLNPLEPSKKSKEIHFKIIFTKSDNLCIEGNRQLFKDKIENGSELNRLFQLIGNKKFYFADPIPQQYPEESKIPREMKKFIKAVFK